MGGMASTAMSFFKKATTGDEVYQRNLRTKTSPADVIMWSGSKDDQTSYVDPIFSDEPTFPFAPSRVAEVESDDDGSVTPYAAYRDMEGNILI